MYIVTDADRMQALFFFHQEGFNGLRSGAYIAFWATALVLEDNDVYQRWPESRIYLSFSHNTIDDDVIVLYCIAVI